MNRSEKFEWIEQPIVLAERPAFTIGNTLIDPPLRSLTAQSTVAVEPRVMQVLVALSDAAGNVVSRERLIDTCWGGLIVGDDSITRAIAELRRAVSRIGAGFEVETIPKVGYRLKYEPEVVPEVSPPSGLSRRSLVIGAAAVAAGGAGLYALSRFGRDDGYEALVSDARTAMRPELPDSPAKAIALLDRAVAIRPDSAEALGLLAMAWRNAAEYASSDKVGPAIEQAETAAKRALAIDPNEGYALTALATTKPYLGDWAASAAKLQAVLKVAPDTIAALSHITTLYQSSGFMDRSKLYNDKALALDPQSPTFQFRDALKAWILGDTARADLIIGRALQVWPRHPSVWNAQLMLFGFTNRPAAGLAVLDNAALGPKRAPPLMRKLWRDVLLALRDRDPASIDRAITSSYNAVRQSDDRAPVALMAMSGLGQLDQAFEVARGYFLSQGDVIAPAFGPYRQPQLADHGWRRSMMLFTPTCLPMRRDARFAGLCDDMGLTEFWALPDNQPDFAQIDARTA